MRDSLGWLAAVVVLGIAAGDALALLSLNHVEDALGGLANANPVIVCMIDAVTAFAAFIAFYAACRKLLRLDPYEALKAS